MQICFLALLNHDGSRFPGHTQTVSAGVVGQRCTKCDEVAINCLQYGIGFISKLSQLRYITVSPIMCSILVVCYSCSQLQTTLRRTSTLSTVVVLLEQPSRKLQSQIYSESPCMIESDWLVLAVQLVTVYHRNQCLCTSRLELHSRTSF